MAICSRGVSVWRCLERWVTPEDAEVDLLRFARMKLDPHDRCAPPLSRLTFLLHVRLESTTESWRVLEPTAPGNSKHRGSRSQRSGSSTNMPAVLARKRTPVGRPSRAMG